MTAHLCACGRPTPNTTVCETCCDRLAHDLADIPAYADELETVLTRQTRYGDRGDGSRPTTRALPFDLRASEASWILRNTLVGWVRVLDETGVDWPAGDLASISRWLLVRVDHLARHEAGHQAVDEINSALGNVRRTVDRPPDRSYAGPCDATIADGTRCGTDLYARAGAQYVTCRVCGASFSVDDRREYLLTELEDVLATATEIGRGVSRLGQPVAASTIRSYAHRGRLEVRGLNLRGDPLYRVGDVLDLLAQQEAKAS